MMLWETVMIRLVITILVEISQIILENTNMENMQGSIFLRGFLSLRKYIRSGKSGSQRRKGSKTKYCFIFSGWKPSILEGWGGGMELMLNRHAHNYMQKHQSAYQRKHCHTIIWNSNFESSVKKTRKSVRDWKKSRSVWQLCEGMQR